LAPSSATSPSCDSIATAAKACPPKGIISVVNGQIDVYEDASTLPLDGMALARLPFVGPTEPFPPWESMIPRLHKTASAPAIGFNAELLAGLAAVAKACDGPECIMHVPETAEGPALFLIGEWRVVIMPLKSEAA
jgi:hypothetical protein